MAVSAIYVDACCFIDAAKHNVVDEAVRARLDKQEVDDLALLKQILTASRDGRVKAYTSALTIAECTATEKGDAKPSEKVKELFRAMLVSGRVVTLVQPDIFLCERARDLRWDHSVVLHGADAIHIATALHKNCEEFITTDSRILTKAKMIEKEFGLRIILPSATMCLPDEYRQQAMPWRGAEIPERRIRPRKRKPS